MGRKHECCRNSEVLIRRYQSDYEKEAEHKCVSHRLCSLLSSCSNTTRIVEMKKKTWSDSQ